MTPALAQGGLQVGGQAQANTQLRMRSGAGLNHGQVGMLQTGAIADVLAGPVSADGYVWWQLKAAGLQGWAAEGGGGNVWLAAHGAPVAQAAAEPAAVSSEQTAARAGDANLDACLDDLLARHEEKETSFNNKFFTTIKGEIAYGEQVQDVFTVEGKKLSDNLDDYLHVYWFYGENGDSVTYTFTEPSEDYLTLDRYLCWPVQGRDSDLDWQGFWPVTQFGRVTEVEDPWLPYTGPNITVLSRRGFFSSRDPHSVRYFPYTFSLRRNGKGVIPPLPSDRPSIEIGGSYSNALPTSDGNNLEEISLRLTEPNNVVSVRATALTGNLVPLLRLEPSKSWIILAQDHNERGSSVVALENLALPANLYHIVIRSVHGSGRYKLEVFAGASPPDTDLPAIDIGGAHTGELPEGEEYDSIQLRVSESDTVISARMTALDGNMVPGLTLWGAGAEVATDANAGGVNIAEFEQVELAAGDYEISAWTVRGGGRYKLEVFAGGLPILPAGAIYEVFPEAIPIPSDTPPLVTLTKHVETARKAADLLSGVCDILITQGAAGGGLAGEAGVGADQLSGAAPGLLVDSIMNYVTLSGKNEIKAAALDEIRQILLGLVADFVKKYNLDKTEEGQDLAALWRDSEQVRQFTVLLADFIATINDRVQTATSGPCSALSVAFEGPKLYEDLSGRLNELANFWTDGGVCRIRSEGEIASRNWPAPSANIAAKVDLRTGAGKLLGIEPLFTAQLPGKPKYYAVLGRLGRDALVFEDLLNFAEYFISSIPRLWKVDEASGFGLVFVRESLVKATGDCTDLSALTVTNHPAPAAGELFNMWLHLVPDDISCSITVAETHYLYDDWHTQGGNTPLNFENVGIYGDRAGEIEVDYEISQLSDWDTMYVQNTGTSLLHAATSGWLRGGGDKIHDGVMQCEKSQS